MVKALRCLGLLCVGCLGLDDSTCESGHDDLPCPPLPTATPRVWSAACLARTNAPPVLLLAVAGEVFDVSAGKSFYGPNRTYGLFAGRDASNAFVELEFNETTAGYAIDDLEQLPPSKCAGVEHWRNFYQDHAKVVGVMWMLALAHHRFE